MKRRLPPGPPERIVAIREALRQISRPAVEAGGGLLRSCKGAQVFNTDEPARAFSDQVDTGWSKKMREKIRN
jgi:hypothetical protein